LCRRPPRSTPFPYTTLFRSSQVAAAIDARMEEIYWGCYALDGGEMRLQGSEAVLPPEQAELPRGASGDWLGAGTGWGSYAARMRSEEHTSELQSRENLVCRL